MSNPTCAHCTAELLNLKSVTPDSKPRIGDLLLCGNCGEPSILTLTGSRKMSDVERAEMTDAERADLDFAIRNIKAHISRQ